VTGLAFGTRFYFALRAINAWGYPGSISNPVSVTTLGVPAMAFDHDSLALMLSPGMSRDTAMLVTNAGAGRLDFTVGSSAPWLGATPGAGRVLAPNSARLALHVDAGALAEGGYDATLPITGNDPVTPARNLAVHLTVTTATAVGGAPRAGFGLRLLSPNPSPGRVVLALSLPDESPAEVTIFDVRGRRVARLADGVLGAGLHTLRWERVDEGGTRLAPGLYFVRARTPDTSALVRIVLLD
jgi:hypothetical protein